MGLILAQAARDGYDILIDGTNASDSGGDRPGMRVLSEKGILSPLRLCGITKPLVRENSKAAGLFTWDKPAYACLATRVRTRECITVEKLQSIEKARIFCFRWALRIFALGAQTALPCCNLQSRSWILRAKSSRL